MVKENRIVPLKMIGIVAILLIVTMTTALAENVDGCYDGVSGAVSRWKLDEAAGGLEDVCGLFAATGAGLTYTYPAPQNFSFRTRQQSVCPQVKQPPTTMLSSQRLLGLITTPPLTRWGCGMLGLQTTAG